MELGIAEALARELLDAHGLTDDGWVFGFDDAPSRLGRCDQASRRITVSRRAVAGADHELLRQLVLHEIAHAITPRDLFGRPAGHRGAWLRTARSIGYVHGATVRWPAG